MYGHVIVWLAGLQSQEAEISRVQVHDEWNTSLAKADNHGVPLWKWHCGRPDYRRQTDLDYNRR